MNAEKAKSIHINNLVLIAKDTDAASTQQQSRS
jgi:hypothetical protein